MRQIPKGKMRYFMGIDCVVHRRECRLFRQYAANVVLGLLIAVSGVLVTMPRGATAQSTDLTRADNHALLYAHQIGFSAEIPTIRMKIADGISAVSMTPRADFSVLPSGPGGASVQLKGGGTYEIVSERGLSGKYRHGVVLARSEQASDLAKARQYCVDHHVDVETIASGALFAVKGNVFDNREYLLMTQRTDDSALLRKNRKFTLPASYAIGITGQEKEIYTELKTYPTAQIVLRGNDVAITNQNLMYLDLGETSATFHDIVGADGKKRDWELSGHVILTPDSNGNLAIVQLADIETLLRGIVPAEIFASAPDAALEAQAIAARTTLIAQVGARHHSDPYHLCNTQHCQVYRGLSSVHPRTDKAIQRTAGQILTWNQKTVHAYYSSHCGGISADNQETWGLPLQPYLISRSDDSAEARVSFKDDGAFRAWLDKKSTGYCDSAPEGKPSFASTAYAHWQQSVDSQTIENHLKKAGASIGTLKNVEIVARGKSYRVTHVRFTGTNGTFDVFKELPIRRIFGGLKSALFDFKIIRSGGKISSLEFQGAGFGHGVGLCQTGAIGMAQRGKQVDDILKHYYPNAEIRKIY